MDAAIGNMGVVLALMAGLALSGLVGAGSSGNDDAQDDDMLPPDADPAEPQRTTLDGTLDGEEGSGAIALNAGEAVLTGGEGNNNFIVTGDESADAPTHAIITDFDPVTDTLSLTARQPGLAMISPQAVQLSITEMETTDGPALEILFEAGPGFEGATDKACFAKVTLIGIEADDLNSENFYVGVDRTVDTQEQPAFV